jgi:NifU-like protein
MTNNNPPRIKDKQGNTWLYSDIVKDHFFNPKNLMPQGDEDKFKADGIGRVGSPACGDEMVVWIKVKDNKITDCKWQTFGCGSAIASTSMMSEMVLENGGMSIEDALKLTPQDILDRLGGLPPNKIHCSVLGDQALEKAIGDYKSRLLS